MITTIAEDAWTPSIYPDDAAWLVIATLAHNLLGWITQIGLGARGELVVAKTLRRSLLT